MKITIGGTGSPKLILDYRYDEWRGISMSEFGPLVEVTVGDATATLTPTEVAEAAAAFAAVAEASRRDARREPR